MTILLTISREEQNTCSSAFHYNYRERCHNIPKFGYWHSDTRKFWKFLIDLLHWREYPNFVSRGKFVIDLLHWRQYPNSVSSREFLIDLAHWHQYPNLRMRAGSDEVTKCAEIFQNFRVLTKFGYSRQCTKSRRNFPVLRKFGYQHLRY